MERTIPRRHADETGPNGNQREQCCPILFSLYCVRPTGINGVHPSRNLSRDTLRWRDLQFAFLYIKWMIGSITPLYTLNFLTWWPLNIFCFVSWEAIFTANNLRHEQPHWNIPCASRRSIITMRSRDATATRGKDNRLHRKNRYRAAAHSRGSRIYALLW